MNFMDYMIKNKDQILSLTLDHIKLTAIAVGLAIVIGIPLGILISYVKKLNKPIIGLANLIQAIPSMALLGFAIPFLGIGTLPAVFMVVLYSLLPIIKNTYTGIQNINSDIIEASKGIGLTKLQILTKVQIPLALPVIMAGIRISAVTAVGLMTMAAFIGGGGLGFLVYSGIRTVNNQQILAGAIPACIMALFVDYLVGLVERLVTPVSLQKSVKSKEKLRKQRSMQKGFISIVAILLIMTFIISTISGMNKSDKVIKIGGKDFTEQTIVIHMMADLIEDKTDISVVRETNLGGTQVAFSALTSGNIDLYVEYTGTAYGDTMKYPPIADMEEVYNTVKKDFKDKYNIEVLKQMGFNNTFVMAVKKTTAEQYNLKTISDLKGVASELTVGTTFEFIHREDGLAGLTKKYGLQFKETIGLDGSARYIAIDNDETDVMDAYATDGLLKKFELVTLEDDQSFFPPYYAIPIVRSEIVEKYPEIVPIIEELGDQLTDEIMIELNYTVDELQRNPEEVAREYLVENGFIKE